MATLSNLAYTFHKLYIFKLVEYFGIFYPQALVTLIVLSYIWMVKDEFLSLDLIPKEKWALSERAIKKIKNQ